MVKSRKTESGSNSETALALSARLLGVHNVGINCGKQEDV